MPAVKGATILRLAIFVALTSVGGDTFKRASTQLSTLHFDAVTLDAIARRYGETARQRFDDWQKLIAGANLHSDHEKLQRVNEFFNANLLFDDDENLWQYRDYWATPVESMLLGAGDCEDFAIAKYFTLLEMGVADSRLRITYVKALRLNQAHMVLTYFEGPQAVPLVLDNLSDIIAPASERMDLQPVYSFNGSGLWQAKQQGEGRRVGDAERLNPWLDLKQRMLMALPEQLELGVVR